MRPVTTRPVVSAAAATAATPVSAACPTARGSTAGDGPSHDTRPYASPTPATAPSPNAGTSSSTAFRPSAAGDTPRTVSRVTSRRRRSNHNDPAAATKAPPASAANTATGHAPPATDVWIACVRCNTNGRWDSKYLVTNSASSAATTSRSSPPYAGIPSMAIGGGLPSTHQSNASTVSDWHASSWISASTSATVTSLSNGAPQAPWTSLTPEVVMKSAINARSTTTTGGGSGVSGPSQARRSAWKHQKSSSWVPARSRYTPATGTGAAPTLAWSPTSSPVMRAARSGIHRPGPRDPSTTSTASSAPLRATTTTGVSPSG